MNPAEWIINTFVSAAFSVWPQKMPTSEALKSTKIIAHRGVHEGGIAQENSIKSFRLALEHQIWAVELDIRFTKDNIPVVIHDADCGRLFNRPDIEIQNILFHDLHNQLPEIASLAEVIKEFGKNLHLMIEVKEDLALSPEKITHLKNLLSQLTPKEDYHMLSLTPEFLEPLKFMPSAALLDVIWLEPTKTKHKNLQFNHGGIAGHFLFFSQKELRELKSQNKQIGVGFLDSRNSLYREVNRGADFIFTNHPLRLKRYLM